MQTKLTHKLNKTFSVVRWALSSAETFGHHKVSEFLVMINYSLQFLKKEYNNFGNAKQSLAFVVDIL